MLMQLPFFGQSSVDENKQLHVDWHEPSNLQYFSSAVMAGGHPVEPSQPFGGCCTVQLPTLHVYNGEHVLTETHLFAPWLYRLYGLFVSQLEHASQLGSLPHIG